MLVLTDFRFATISELFQYKKQGFSLPPFHGYSSDQWGIKAHNRPWINDIGNFKSSQKIIEIGGAYSTLPVYLADKYNVEAWIGDDFGESSGENNWSRWGDPHELPNIWPKIKYIFKSLGEFSNEYPESYFDRVFSVSTLEHIASNNIINVFKDMHRILAKNGVQLHTIDIYKPNYKNILLGSILEHLSINLMPWFLKEKLKRISPVWYWLHVIKESGVDVSDILKKYPYLDSLFGDNILYESYDVVYRFYPPNDNEKKYCPATSLLVRIEDV